jgi:hypothetical protein
VAPAGGALLVNAWWDALTVRLPGDGPWAVKIDADPADGRIASGGIELAGASLVLLSSYR